MMGIKISFMQRVMKITQRGTRKEIRNKRTNFLSLMTSLTALLPPSTGIFPYNFSQLGLQLFFVSDPIISIGSGGGDSSSSFSLFWLLSDLFSMRKEPMRKEMPLRVNITLDALKTLLLISGGKKASSFTISALKLSGLVMPTKVRFQMIIPREKKRTADPETLLRSLGNCDQRQFSTGMELIAKQVMGTSRQKSPIVNRLRERLIRQGEKAKMQAQILTTVLYPSRVPKRAERNTAKEAGMTAQSMMRELVSLVISVPLLRRQEKKQMLIEPHSPITPVASLIRAVPMKVLRAGRSASLSIFIIFHDLQSTDRSQPTGTSYKRSDHEQQREDGDGEVDPVLEDLAEILVAEGETEVEGVAPGWGVLAARPAGVPVLGV